MGWLWWPQKTKERIPAGKTILGNETRSLSEASGRGYGIGWGLWRSWCWWRVDRYWELGEKSWGWSRNWSRWHDGGKCCGREASRGWWWGYGTDRHRRRKRGDGLRNKHIRKRKLRSSRHWLGVGRGEIRRLGLQEQEIRSLHKLRLFPPHSQALAPRILRVWSTFIASPNVRRHHGWLC